MMVIDPHLYIFTLYLLEMFDRHHCYEFVIPLLDVWTWI